MKVANVVVDSEMNVITADVGNDKYVLVFDGGDTLCEVIINDVGDCDYNEELIDEIISLS